MSDFRWRGLSHQELYDQIWDGPGAQLSDQAQKIWRDAGMRITEINNDLTRKLGTLVATFDGAAAAASTRSLVPLEDWQEEARQGANRTANGLQYQADDVAKVRNAMPPPEPSSWPEYPSWLGNPQLPLGIDPLFFDDWYAADARQSDLAAQAVYVMETYEQSSGLNRDLIRPVDAPPTVTSEVSSNLGRATGTFSSGFIASAGTAVGASTGFSAGPLTPVPAGADGISTPPPSAGASPGGSAAGGMVPVGAGAAGGAAVAGLRPGQVPGGNGGAVPAGQRPGVGGSAGGQGIPPRPAGGGFGGLTDPAGGPRPPGQFPGGVRPGGIGPGGIGTGGLAPGGGGGLGPSGGAGGVPGGGAGTGAGGLSPSGTGPAGTNAGSRPPGSPGFFPGLGAGAGGGGAREHRRPSYLVDDTDAFGDHRWITSGVLTPNDRPSRRRTTDEYY